MSDEVEKKRQNITPKKSLLFLFLLKIKTKNEGEQYGGGIGGRSPPERICDFRSVFDDFLLKNIH